MTPRHSITISQAPSRLPGVVRHLAHALRLILLASLAGLVFAIGTVDSYSVLALRGDSRVDLSGQSTLGGMDFMPSATVKSKISYAITDPDGRGATAQRSGGWSLPPQFSLETDVYVPASNAASSRYILLQAGTGPYWALSLDNTRTPVFEYTVNDGAGEVLKTYSLGTVLATNAWVRLAVTRDASNTLRLFLNGALKKTFTTASGSPALAATQPLGLGWSGQNTSNAGHPFYLKNINLSFGITRYIAAYNATTVETSWGSPVLSPVTLPGHVATVNETRLYDPLGRIASSTDGLGNTTRYTHDAQGNLTSLTDPAGNTTTYLYDKLNRLIQKTGPVKDAASGNQIESYSYDPLGNITQVRDGMNNATTYSPDALGNLPTRSSPDTATTTATFDDAGNRLSLTDARGKTVSQTYDALNRVLTASDGTILYSYGYDAGTGADGKLTSVTGGGATVTLAYDSLGRLATLASKIGTPTLTQTYSYNPLGQLSGLKYPSGAQLAYSYSHGRISGISLNGNPVISDIVYGRGQQPISWRYGNGLSYAAPGDAAGRIAGMSIGSQNSAYRYDAKGNLIGVADGNADEQNYSYDPYNRLTGADIKGVLYSYQYDENGNRLRSNISNGAYTDYAYQAGSNRLATLGGATTQSLSHDAAGNLLSDGTYTYTWDGYGRLASSLKGTTTTVYGYDGLGQRHSKGSRRYAYDATGNLIGEYASNGTLGSEYVYFAGNLIAIWRGGMIYAVHPDHLGTPRMVTDSAGAVRWTWAGEPFGNTNPDANPADLGAFTLNLRHPGQYYDSETTLFFNNARYYDPGLGRYISSDPIGLAGGMNTYAYVENDPINFIDPEGLTGVRGNTGGRRVPVSPTQQLETTLSLANVNRLVSQIRTYDPNFRYAVVAPRDHTYSRQDVEYLNELLRQYQASQQCTANGQPRPPINYGSTPNGVPFTRHYGTETGPVRNLPGSVIDNAITNGTPSPGRSNSTVYFDPVNNVTVVVGGGGVMSAHKN